MNTKLGRSSYTTTHPGGRLLLAWCAARKVTGTGKGEWRICWSPGCVGRAPVWRRGVLMASWRQGLSARANQLAGLLLQNTSAAWCRGSGPRPWCSRLRVWVEKRGKSPLKGSTRPDGCQGKSEYTYFRTKLAHFLTTQLRISSDTWKRILTLKQDVCLFMKHVRCSVQNRTFYQPFGCERIPASLAFQKYSCAVPLGQIQKIVKYCVILSFTRPWD